MMSIKLGWLAGPQAWRMRGLFNQAGRGGPRRLPMIVATGIGVVALVLVLILPGHHEPPVSFDARMKPVDPLPGGQQSTPEQDALAYRADKAEAAAAANQGVSYTPPIAASVPVVTAPRREEPPGVVQAPPQPHFVAKPASVYRRAAVIPPPTTVATPAVATVPLPRVIKVAQQDDPQQQQVNEAAGALLNQWNVRPPRTDVVLPPTDTEANGPARATNESVQRVSQAEAATGHILIPAGRGIYAHPVLALSSDQVSPAVFQADSGPIAGDRMIGSFSKENNRLLVRITTVIHNGEPIGTNGVVIAPDTMEAAVASGVDQHYLTRFLLPAAAAFVQGLGQALAATSNTAAVLSPFGGVATTTHLNIDQQLGVAAGAAAANIGSTLNAAAPKGPTITLDANVAVGVMFLSDVVAHDRY